MERRKATTLKEKLADHYQKRDFSVKPSIASQVGMTFFGFMTISLLFESLLILIPAVYKDGETTRRVCQLLVFFTLFEMVANWYYTYNDVKNHVKKTSKDIHFPNSIDTPPGWKTCPVCQLDAPPRSHHCALCGKCILKRDHHCFFTGSCVGLQNQRTFVVFCVYLVWGNLFALFLQLSYLNDAIPLFSSYAVDYVIVVAFWKLITGAMSFGIFIILVHVYLCIFCLGSGIFFFCWQAIIILNGQTSYEAWKQISAYQSSTLENLRSVFGPLKYCWVLLLAPVPVRLPHDGLKWHITKSNKGH